MRRSSREHGWCLLLTALSCAAASPARAAEALPPPSPAQSTPVAASTLEVVLHSDSTELSLESVQRALTEELGNDSHAGVVTVTYRAASRELAITYSGTPRGTMTRVLPAPADVREVPGLAALVAGNLVRDQSTELLPPSPAPPAAPAPPPTNDALEKPRSPPPPLHWFGNAAIFYPLATNALHPDVHTNFDFNLLYGRIGQLDGLELGMVSSVSGEARGVQASVISNLVEGRVQAGQLSFIFNRGRSVEGLQVALVNRSDDSLEGLQVGGVNFAGSRSQGAQVSLLNVAGDLNGLQLGLINIGKRVRGTQIGLVNVADEVEGIPIGLVSVSRAGGVHPVLWSSTSTYGNLGVKFATRYTYTMLQGALHATGDHTLVGAGFLIGATIPISKRVATDIDVGGLHLFANTPCCRDRFTGAIAREYDQSLGKVRAAARFEVLPHLSLFAGTGMTGKVTYPVRGGDTYVELALIPELFGGVQL